jgi:preprotein translocase subunit YajC
MSTLAQIGAKPTEGPSAGAAPATSTAPGSPAATPGAQPQGPNLLTLMLPVIAVFAFMMIMQSFRGKKEQKKRDDMLSGLGKGDRVLTIGGQLGVVDQVRDQEVVLRIDENSNVKARFTKASIQTVLESVNKPATSDANAPSIEVKAKSDNPVPAR